MKNSFLLLSRLRAALLTLVLMLGCSFAFAQTKTISGTVTGAGLPLPGVNVKVKGGNTGAVTDFDGLYKIDASEGDLLEFSSIGFVTQTSKVGAANTIDIALVEDVEVLDEVVVVGYDTQKRSEQLAGVNVQASSGEPGARINIQIRGASTINNGNTQGEQNFASINNLPQDPNDAANGPLYVVDGIILPEAPDLSPNEVESIEVLKDAASAAIYGNRAAGGVILITTKKAKPGKLKFNFSTYTALNKITSRFPTLNGPEFINLNYQYFLNSGANNPAILTLNQNADGLLFDTDFQDFVLNDNAISKNYNLRVSGGSENLNSSIVLDHINQEGVFLSSDFKRTLLRVNTNLKQGRFKSAVNLNMSRSFANRAPWGILYDAVRNPASSRGPNEVEENTVEGDENEVNILSNILQKIQETNTSEALTVGASIRSSYDIGYGLTARFNVNGYRTATDNVGFVPAFRYVGEDGELLPNRIDASVATLSQSQTIFQQAILEGIIQWNKSFGSHKFGLLAGYTVQDGVWETKAQAVFGFPELGSLIPTASAGTRDREDQVRGTFANTRTLSQLGTFSYNYKGKYIARANIRRDGSNKFGPRQQFGTFWGVSGAWDIAKENFVSDTGLSFIKQFKLRASHGRVGNDRIGSFLPVANLQAGKNVPLGLPIDGRQRIGQGSVITGVASRNLTWETKISNNIGLDMQLWKGAFTLSAEYYQNEVEDLLFGVLLPGSSGQDDDNFTTNIAALENTGYELTAGFQSKKKALKWGINGTFTTNRNEITRLAGLSDRESLEGVQRIIPFDNNFPRIPVTSSRLGEQVGAFFVFRTDGIIRNQEELDAFKDGKSGAVVDESKIGDVRFVDVNGDGEIDVNDRTFSGNSNPDFEAGLNFNMSYKNFDFNMSWYGAYGGKIFNAIKASSYRQRNHRDLLTAFTPENTTSDIGIVSVVGGATRDEALLSDIFIEDGDYIRLRNIQLGYTIPKDATKKYGINKMRIYFWF